MITRPQSPTPEPWDDGGIPPSAPTAWYDDEGIPLPEEPDEDDWLPPDDPSGWCGTQPPARPTDQPTTAGKREDVEVACAVCHEAITVAGPVAAGTRWYHEACTESGRRDIAARETQRAIDLRKAAVKDGLQAAFFISPVFGVVAAFVLAQFLYSTVLILSLAGMVTMAAAVVIYVHELTQ